MPLVINKENYSIRTRCGDSGTIVFKFNLPLDDYSAVFCISKDVDFKETKPVIKKCYTNVTGNLLQVNLTSDETGKLETEGSFTGKYYWGLKIYNENGFATTLIPDRFNRRPRFFVYPKI